MVKSPWHLFKVGLLALMAVIGFDLFLHAGVLESLYSSPNSFLLPSEEAFQRIPFGYLSIAILIMFFVWIAYRLNVKSGREGLTFGLIFGAITWGSLTLGLYSISTANPVLLLGWFIGQTVELGIAGMVVGTGLPSSRLRPILIAVAVFFVVMFVLTVILQNI